MAQFADPDKFHIHRTIPMAQKKSSTTKRIKWNGTLDQVIKGFSDNRLRIVTKRSSSRLVIPGIDRYAKVGDTISCKANGDYTLKSK